MNINPDLLASLNLSDAEGAVYVATLELGESSILDIARKSGVKRSSIYNFLDELKARGLIIETKKKKRAVFSAAPPRALLEIEHTRLKELQRLLPELEAVENKSKTKPRVTFYNGVEGIKYVYADSLNGRDTVVHGFADFEAGLKLLGEEFYTEYYLPERVKRGILYRGILRDDEMAKKYQQRNNKDLRDSKIMTGEGVTTEIDIYNNKVALMSFRAKVPFAVLIEDQYIAQSLRLVWQQLWDRLPEVETSNNQAPSKTLKDEMENQLKGPRPT